MKQFVLTVAMGKRLIGKAIAVHPAVTAALRTNTVAVLAGTTNGCVAEEILDLIGQKSGFARRCFFRGITLPPNYKVTDAGRLPEESAFTGDVIIREGKWLPGARTRETINDVVSELKEGDIIIKGRHAVPGVAEGVK